MTSTPRDSQPHRPPRSKTTQVNTPILFSCATGWVRASAVSSIPWLTAAPHLIYWGDMGGYGFEIVDNFRRESLPVHTILMDQTAYERYEKYGSSSDTQGRPLKHAARKPLLHLTATERALYEHLTDPSWTRFLRIEQERIPLQVAADAVMQSVRLVF